MTNDRTGPSKSSVARVAFPTAVVVLAINLTIRGIALGRFEVSPAALPLIPLVMASVGATLGSAFGYYMAFRRPGPASMKKFLIPCAVVTLIGIGIEVFRFGVGHGEVGALFVGASQGLMAIALALLALFVLVSFDNDRQSPRHD